MELMLRAKLLSRAPHGARGLKFVPPSRMPPLRGRAPHGARGLKFHDGVAGIAAFQSRPHGARGLKLNLESKPKLINGSRPARGAWIEIPVFPPMQLCDAVAPRTGRVD